jgi:drug/metabolite transporter (DMT)-like permease
VAVRNGIGSMILGFAILRGNRHVLRNLPWVHLIVLGVLAAGLPEMLLLETVRRCGAIVAVMLVRIEIPMGVILAHFLLKERVTRMAYVAAVLALAGVWLISLRPGQSFDIHQGFYVGIGLGLLTGGIWALAGVYGKFILKRGTDPMAVSFVRLSVGAAFGVVITAIFVRDPWQALARITIHDWLMLGYLGVFLSGFGYMAFYKSMKLLDAHVVSILGGVSIAVLLILGYAIGETATILQWVGIALVVASIYLVQKQPAAPIDPVD